MSRLKQVSCALLHGPERAISKLALLARGDCIHGGASALTLADRLTFGKLRFEDKQYQQPDVSYHDIVSAAYASSTGEVTQYLPYECPECGQARLGETAALECCANIDDELCDGLCDQCMRSGVEIARTNFKGETICVDCDEDYHEQEGDT